MLLTVTHTTRYAFADSVTHGLQRLRLKPKSTHGQEVIEWDMDLSGAKREAEYDDQHHNHTELVSIEPGVPEVVVTCRGTVRTMDNNGVTGQHTGHMPLWCFLRPTPLTRAGNRVRSLVASIGVDRHDTLNYLHALSHAIAEQVEYLPGTTDVTTTAEQSLTAGQGVCQDHAHIFISAGRLLDIPMRYVGGYLLMDEKVEQEAGHGWAEAYVQGLGWVGFDISNAICPDERYIRVATGCDYSEAAPVTGIAIGAGETQLDVHLSVGQKMLGGQQQSSPGGQQQQMQGR
ncbi:MULTISPECIES: transglutaminase family protein [Novosphingobium]|uniref:Transglutaminase-like protein n=1 Tax=Novosphingobium pentaromativorans US6-1 TaxID=1088721 RepID=G6E8E5_9SPHN|nr:MULTISPECIES: transglutaminase family protein [Novosphingobium]AIT81367.1 transglutaminase [Novosphingobium pentaromativorans US6-1]EHJ62485.1 transglutaminase-like protein [Novosphingobium pentaromativorans US6-1]GFM29889.1 transglutaminase [Novosphingobium sp. PY1]CCA92827.1 transglutaminase-like [Novosphingobium sp. PP1Y]